MCVAFAECMLYLLNVCYISQCNIICCRGLIPRSLLNNKNTAIWKYSIHFYKIEMYTLNELLYTARLIKIWLSFFTKLLARSTSCSVNRDEQRRNWINFRQCCLLKISSSSSLLAIITAAETSRYGIRYEQVLKMIFSLLNSVLLSLN